MRGRTKQWSRPRQGQLCGMRVSSMARRLTASVRCTQAQSVAHGRRSSRRGAPARRSAGGRGWSSARGSAARSCPRGPRVRGPSAQWSLTGWGGGGRGLRRGREWASYPTEQRTGADGPQRTVCGTRESVHCGPPLTASVGWLHAALSPDVARRKSRAWPTALGPAPRRHAHSSQAQGHARPRREVCCAPCRPVIPVALVGMARIAAGSRGCRGGPRP